MARIAGGWWQASKVVIFKTEIPILSRQPTATGGPSSALGCEEPAELPVNRASSVRSGQANRVSPLVVDPESGLDLPLISIESPTEPTNSEGTISVIGRIATPRISVVIPALNEADNLRHVLQQLPADLFEVILVDGRSSDASVEVTRSMWPSARILTQPRTGKGDALAEGFRACRGDIIVMLDADGSADPAEIPRFVNALTSGADYAKGTRFADGGGSDDITWLRRVGNRLLVGLVNVLYGTDYTDLCYGLNAFWAHCLAEIDVDCVGFEVEALLNLRVTKSEFIVREVGSYERRRLYGNSKLRTVRDGFRILRVILAERLPRWRREAEPVGIAMEPMWDEPSQRATLD